MAVERNPHSPPQPLRYEDYFYLHRKSFTQAAASWSSARMPSLAITSPPDQVQIIRECQTAVVTQFGPETLTPYAESFVAPLLYKYPFVFLSEGTPDIQDAKIRQYANHINLPLPDHSVIVSRDKMGQLPQVAEKIIQIAVRHEGKLPHLVLIEDKVVNLIKIAAQLVGASPDFIPDEDRLNNPQFDFDTFMTNCTMLFSQSSFLRNSLSAVYIPPDKPPKDQQDPNLASLTSQRISALMKSINDLQRHRYFPQLTRRNKPFMHVKDAANLIDMLPKNSFVITDYDGPIGSQRLTLETRDATINTAFAQSVERIYQSKYGCSPQVFHEILINRASTAFIDTSGEHTYELTEERPRAIITKMKNPNSGTLNISIRMMMSGHNEVVHLDNINPNEYTQSYKALAPYLSGL